MGMHLSRVCCLALLATLLPVSAQEPAEKKEAPTRQVRFLPVGDAPPFRTEERGGVRYELEPPAGSVPPREVLIGFGEEEPAAVPLLLGRMSVPLKAPGGSGPMTLRRRDDGADAEPWLKVARPEDSDFLVLLWRASPKATWAEAKALVLPDSPAAAPAGRVRIVNLSPVGVGVVFGGEKIALLPGKIYQRQVAPGKDHPIELGAVMKEKAAPTRFYSGTVFQNPGERTLVVIYRADGDQPRRPLKAIVEREPVIPPKPPPTPAP